MIATRLIGKLIIQSTTKVQDKIIYTSYTRDSLRGFHLQKPTGSSSENRLFHMNNLDEEPGNIIRIPQLD